MVSNNPNTIKDIDNPSDSLIKKCIDKNPEIYRKCPPLNEEMTKYCYYKLFDKWKKDQKSTTPTAIIYDLRYFKHKISDEIRIHAFNNEKRLNATAALKNIAPLSDGEADIQSLSSKVIEKITDTYVDNIISDAGGDDYEIVMYLSKFTRDVLLYIDDKYADIMFNKIRSSISSDINKDEFINAIYGSRKDISNFAKKFDH